MRWVAAIWVGALVVGIFAGWIIHNIAYPDRDVDSGNRVEATYAAQISTARAATAAVVSPTNVLAPAGSPAIPPTPTAQPPVLLAGSGTELTEPVALQPGFNVAAITHDGEGIFRVVVINPNGERGGQLASGSGAWDGSRSIIVLDAGEYAFDVTADGAWTIAVARVDPAPERVRALPAEIAGSQYQSLYFFAIEPGAYTVALTCESGPIRVALTNNHFRNRGTLIEDDCPIDTTIEVTSAITPSDTIAIDVMGSGEWTIAVRDE
jgi:hypothetical protein